MTAPQRAGQTRRAVGFVVVGVVVGAVAVLLGGSASADTPPWQQPGNVNFDPNRVGTLSFFDSSGNQIFSGSTDAAPFAAYVAGSDGLRTGDTLASLYAYLPANSPAAGWTGGLLSATSAFPVQSAPTTVAALTGPIETGGPSDTSLADFVTGHPNPSNDAAFSGSYELRLRTSAPGQSATATYDAADVRISGDTWQVVYPQHFLDTTTALTVTPDTSLHAGATVTLHASVTSAEATGTIQFTDGATSLGSVAVSSGTASKSVKLSTAGTHALHATYEPAADSTFGSSTGNASVSVAKAASSTAGAWPTGHLAYGTKFTVKAAVTATGITPTGSVSVKLGPKTVASASLSSGKATLTVPATALAPGKHTLTLVYAGSSNAATSSTAKTLTIARATSHTSNSLSPPKIKKTKRAKLTVKVTATGTTPAGSVSIYDGTKKIAAGNLAKGRVTVTLPVLAKVGKHKIHAVYAGSSLVATSKSATATLTVTS